MEWINDALAVYFAHMKNDQEGSRRPDPRHIYANPVHPEICHVLSLALYLLSYGFEDNPLSLFPGGSQYSRFEKALKRVFLLDDVKAELLARGLKPSDLGTHSIRKGMASYCSSGSTACPSAIAIQLRVGWTLEGVQNRYIRFEKAGDQHVGRTACGLPADSVQFAILPPFFPARDGEIAQTMVELFPRAPENMYRILEFCLAGLVFHEQFLRHILPPSHLIFSSRLFLDPNLLTSLKQKVQCRVALPMDPITPTGIPPHVALLIHIMKLKEDVVPALQQLAPTVVAGVEQILEERAIGAGTVTRDGLEGMLSGILDRAGVFQLISTINAPRPTQPEPPPFSDQHPHHWDGIFHRVPRDFVFPSSLQAAFLMWCCGDSTKGWPPLRYLTPSDMASTNMRKRLSDYRFLMKRCECFLRQRDQWIESPTLPEATTLFEMAKEALPIPETTQKIRKRRKTQLQWISVTAIIRTNEKRQRT